MLWSLAGGLKPRRALAGAAACLSVLIAVLAAPRWDPLIANSGPFIYFPQIAGAADIERAVLGVARTLFHEEGVEATVSVFEHRTSLTRFLRINGKSDASDRDLDMSTQVLLGEIPALLHPAPKKALVIGLASGVTAGSVLLHPVERVDCLEISPEVARARHFFDHVNHLQPGDPRFHLIIDDARRRLALSDERYDLIISEPSNLWIAGMSSLFTEEFFAEVRRHLQPGGLAVMWLGNYDMDADVFKMLLRTFSSVFPHTTIWESSPVRDHIFAGGVQPIEIDPAAIAGKMSVPGVRDDLKRIGIVDAADFLSQFLMGPDAVRRAAGEGRRQTDDRLETEFVMPRVLTRPQEERMFGLYREVLINHETALGLIRSPGADLAASLAAARESRRKYYEALFLARLRPQASPADLETAWREVYGPAREGFLRSRAARMLAAALAERALSDYRGGEEAAAGARLWEALRLDPDNLAVSARLIKYYLAQGDRGRAAEAAEAALSRRPRDPLALTALSMRARAAGDLAGAEKHLRNAAAGAPYSFECRYNLANLLFEAGKYEESLWEARAALELDPGSGEAMLAIAKALEMRGEAREAAKWRKKAASRPARPPME